MKSNSPAWAFLEVMSHFDKPDGLADKGTGAIPRDEGRKVREDARNVAD